ncbi:MAG: hypothetical protein GYB20_05720 [Oceanospirillales bacterium]|nr:hypothetical protein [Oceanospirillales bacterium]MBR9887178.1 hypothetical protein [Oceanospirillales bacterium]
MGSHHHKEPKRSSLSRDTSAASKAKKKKADDYARLLAERINMYQSNGITSLTAIANKLTDQCVEKPRGKYNWSKTDVRRLIDRLEGLQLYSETSLGRFFNWD